MNKENYDLYLDVVRLVIEKYKSDIIRVDGMLDMTLMKKIVKNIESDSVRFSFPKTAVLRSCLTNLGYDGDHRVRPYKHQVERFTFLNGKTPHVALFPYTGCSPSKAIESLKDSMGNKN